jgi:hypothetical protein
MDTEFDRNKTHKKNAIIMEFTQKSTVTKSGMLF